MTFSFSLYFPFQIFLFSFHLCLFVALVLSFPLTFLLFCCFGVVSLSGDDGLPLCNWLHHQIHNGNSAEVIGIEKNRKLDITILHTSPKKAKLKFLEIGLSLIDEKDVPALPTRRNSINYVVSYGFLLLDHAVQIDFV